MSEKPLGMKNYGSIPHLPGSRMGPGDHHCHPGQSDICTVKSRDKYDVIIVQEKLDGSNVGVAKINGEIIPLTRAGWHANTSPYEQHHRFAGWVRENWVRFDATLQEGERIVGEWLAQAHGTRYMLPGEPFVAFDLMRSSERAAFVEFTERFVLNFDTPKLLSHGGPLSIVDAMDSLGEFGWHGAIDKAEGCVWRVERHGKFDFLAKYVRPDKVDGIYLPSVSGKPEVWNA